jgi:hypothetical protein
MNDGVALIVLGVNLEAKLAAQREHAILPFAQPRAADGDDVAIHSGPVPGATAHPVARLEQRDRFSSLPQPTRSRKTGEPGAHDAVIYP